MSITEIWLTPQDNEVTVETRWPRPPIVQGSAEDREAVLSLLDRLVDRLATYGAPVTIPDVDREFAGILTEAGLTKSAYLRRPDTAAQLLRAAVRQAEESVQQHINLLKWKAERDEASQRVEPVDFVFVSLFADRALDASRTAVILAIASAEAFINQVAIERLSVWDQEDDRLSILSKWLLVARHLSGGQTFAKGEDPYQSFRGSVRLRDRLVHPKPAPDRFDVDRLLEAVLGQPDWDASITSGREACLSVRKMHLEFARLTGAECPTWVGVVPPADADDLLGWRGAAVLHGVRLDPDFSNAPTDALPIQFPSADSPGSEQTPTPANSRPTYPSSM